MEEINIDSDLGLGQGFMPGAVSSEEFSDHIVPRSELFNETSKQGFSDSELCEDGKTQSRTRRFFENLRKKAKNNNANSVADCDCVANLGKMATKSSVLPSQSKLSSKLNHKKLFSRKKGLLL